MMQMNNFMNPIAQLAQRINRLTQINAQARQLEQVFRKKSPQEMEQYFRNLCKERGITVEDFARSLGITIPSNR